MTSNPGKLGKIDWTTPAGLRTTKPGSVDELQTFLKKELKNFNWATIVDKSFQCGVAATFPLEVVDWCTKWLCTKRFDARSEKVEHGWLIIVSAMPPK